MHPTPQLPEKDETLHLQQQIVRLQALLEAARQVHATVHEEEVLTQVLRIVVRELEMSGAAFLSAGLVHGQISDGERPNSAYPLLDRDGQLLAELLIEPPGGRSLTLYEADFIEGLALQAAVALENARNHQRNLEYARLQQDLDAARQIQRSLLPQRLPELPGYSLAFRSDACYEVGGDYLDLVAQPDGALLMAVADVAGKGLASAIMSTGFRSAFRAVAASAPPLDQLAARMNRHHWREGEEARLRYVTALFVRLHPDEGWIEAVNAGHNPGFLLQPGMEPQLIHASGTPLGLIYEATYVSERFRFPPGSRLLLYTDGLTEVFCGDEEFSAERLMDCFSRSPELCSDAILDALWTAVAEFSAGSPPGDDRTALALCRTSPVETMP